jgi:proline iminopeptidase
MSRESKLVTVSLAFCAYAFGVRPRLRRWGATDHELHESYPGADLVPDGRRSATTARTIAGPPSAVWPWLVQMGVDRGGWYSWDRLDNFGRRSTERIHPEWQEIAVGQHLNATPTGSMWWEVAACEPERFLALRMSLDLRGRPFDPTGARPRWFTDSTWCWLLRETPEGATRIVESGYFCLRPSWLAPIVDFLFIDAQHCIMQTRQFANLDRRVAREASAASRRGSVTPVAEAAH